MFARRETGSVASVSMATKASAESPSLRVRAARTALRAASRASQVTGLGSGSTIGGRIGLILAPDLLERLGAGRTVVLVTGTNGKTTTTRLIAEALGPDAVATNTAGANLPAGLAGGLARSPAGTPAVLEVDERYLGVAEAALHPAVIVVLNVSRDQLDRMSEVRMVAQRWHEVLSRTEATVVANADDPLVAFAARGAGRVVWVAAGGAWHADAYHCPVCDSRLRFHASGWRCDCGFERPAVDAAVVGDRLELPDGTTAEIALSLPGRFNLANAALAAMAARALGVELGDALAAAQRVETVEGRYETIRRANTTARLLLAKNPAGWAELIGLLEGHESPLVVAINARAADGHDPSWLWDVEFERLRRRFVVASGERARDLAVRLRHAEISHATVSDQIDALGIPGPGVVDYIGNYTAFQSLRRAVRRGPARARARPAAPVREAPTVQPRRDRASTLGVVVVHPDLLGTYGDAGNARVLANRARWRGYPAELVLAPSDEPLPEGGDLYLLGGGEDGPQSHSAAVLSSGALERAVDAGATVLAVCAGFQIIGTSFPGSRGVERGLGLVDAQSLHTNDHRAVGEVVVDMTADAHWPLAPGRLSGFENHQARTRLGASARPLGAVRSGVGNGFDHVDGAVHGRVFATYLHGPVLARNPAFADLLLALALGEELPPLDDHEEQALHAERLSRSRLRR
jgi:lipid II isoglutaminyl synthase (glutamine-hydrolysing)